MDAITRRRFLLASAAGGGALATGATSLAFTNLLLSAIRPDTAGGNEPVRRLVIVTLYGGNDGLNTVIPYADPAYQSGRPELAYPAEQVLPLTDSLGLNPTLRGLKRVWDEKRMAIVLGVGYPKPDRSHFRSMDIWQTASPTHPVHTGWVGRWLDAIKAPAEMAVSFEPVLPPLLVGVSRAGACVRANGLRLPVGIEPEAIAGLGARDPGDSPMQARSASAYTDLLQVDRLIREAEKADSPADPDEQPAIPATDTGGGNALAAQLALVAQCIEAGVPTRVFSVSLGGFDTHAAERPGHEGLLRKLDAALASFVTRMAASEAGRQVAVMVYSEFGRRVRANASDGTDHGTAGPMLLLGSCVVPGLHGEQPSLTDLDDGDLKATADFRDVTGTVLAAVLDADPARYIDGHKVRELALFTPLGK